MRAIISKGKTVEEAIQVGLSRLKVREEEVDIEVIQQESHGFIGVGRKQAIVRLARLHSNNQLVESGGIQSQQIQTAQSIEDLIDSLPTEEDSHSFEQMVEENDTDSTDNEILQEQKLKGKAWVQDNQIYVKDSPTHFSTISIDRGIQLKKNGQVVKTPSTVVSEQDAITFKVDEPIEQESKFTISLENNHLTAVLHVEPGYIITKQLHDVEPNEHIELTVKEIKEPNLTIQYRDILAKLESLNIVFGLNHSEIMKAVNATEPGKYEVATGTAAKAGKNGWIELKVDINQQNGLFEDENGNVDFRDSKLIPTVEKGQVIGVIHPPIPGMPGISVTNERLPAKQSHPMKVNSGKGVIEVADKLVATEAGRPSIEIRGQLVKASVIPKLVHYDNVNLASGNIRFTGDVEIAGEVEENMLVEAEGDIFVHKSVSMAKLTTSKSIIIKNNVIGSELAAGKHNMLIVELGHLLRTMHVQVERMVVFIKQLMQSPAFKSSDISKNGLQPLIKLLLEKRFKNFVPYAKKYQQVVQQGRRFLDDDEWIRVGISIQQIFLTLSNQITTLDRLNSLSQQMKQLSDFSKIPVEPNAFITLSDTINSSLYCNGDINIIGKGCINTKVHAGGHLTVKGVVRGGNVYGRLGVTLNETGSPSGVKTIISVPVDQKITIDKAMEGTIIKFGNVSYKFIDERKFVTARLENDTKIVFE